MVFAHAGLELRLSVPEWMNQMFSWSHDCQDVVFTARPWLIMLWGGVDLLVYHVYRGSYSRCSCCIVRLYASCYHATAVTWNNIRGVFLL